MVNVPDDESNNVNFIDLYVKIVEHSLDALEPFIFKTKKKKKKVCLCFVLLSVMYVLW